MTINFRKIGRRLLRFTAFIVILILCGYIFLYIKQERFFFNPKILDKDYVYSFDQPFEEINISVEDDVNLNALLFKTDSISKGVILYFHGNAGAIHEWGERAYLYTENNFDVLFVDYRGYGKSDSFYEEESELYNDAQKIYDYVLTRYNEKDVIVLGYSIGTGFASYTAAKNNPKLLILEAPYYAWNEFIASMAPVPQALINYEIPSYKFLGEVNCPVRVFHGSRDFLIKPEEHSKRLKKLYPDKIELTLIKGAGHNGIYLSKQYYDELKELLARY
ncbi:alpha/beta fold hydrolase [uncultured Aquimarina sp.]|uniref:alpha/beta hydrolase n=1 Tax=uncultured Aquimarina sp. TaxID=575652 RepID=UPI00262E3947|nr:alpha/beta fold hydrolase [uncultured Aquimarina sp.]